MLRFAAVASALTALISSAHASFDLVMVMDVGTKSIHRFDGITGSYLGSFGNGMLNFPDSFAIDRTSGRAFVFDASMGMTRVFNYNTGAHLADFSITGNAQTLTFGNGRLIRGFVGGAFWSTFDGNGTYLGGMSGTSTIANPVSMGGAVMESGRFVGLLSNGNNNGLNELLVFNTAATNATQVGNNAFGGPAYYDGVQQVAVGGNRVFLATSPANGRLFSVNPSSGAITQDGSYSMPGLLGGAAFGHGNQLYYSQNDGGVKSISRSVITSSNSIVEFSTFGQGFLVNPTMMQVVAAPEPGTLAILGMGVAALMRRRNRR